MGYCPKVSIITVCMNSKRYVEDAIKSVCGQTYLDIEYIVIDGGSTDGSVEIFNRYKNKIDKLVVEKDNGIFEAMNKGIRLATGEIVYFLNSDDMLYDNKVIERIAPLFIDNKNADFVYGNIEVLDPVKGISYIERYPERISRGLFIRKTIGHPATFFRSLCFKKVGFFDQRYKIAADYDWFLRAIFTKGLKGMHTESNVSIFRLGGVSTDERNSGLYLSERDLIQKRYFNNLEMLCSRVFSGVRRIVGKDACSLLHDMRVKVNA